MSINPIIINNLKGFAPTSFQKYTGKADTYITFFEYNQGSALNADDDEQITRHSIQVDIWSKGDYTQLTNQVKDKLKQLGFTKIYETEMYEEAESVITYHKLLRFFYFSRN
ncbi:hypothetical protein [Rossellomorea sp. DA94]|uniref:hypothetical protein n=1 Tax=Rossellomorea sp. DA94 TaxID=3038653 RepID=UPI00244CAA2E|nr:hypothetical protein [Rossellomorea sp. DA94]WGG47685.1 hypothetical protein P8596_10945 [Rossellomorea sp. DA94]